MVTIRSAAAPLENLHNHRSSDHVATCKILGVRCVPLHEPLTILINEVTALASTPFGHQRAGTVNTGGVELPHLHILSGHTGSQRHAHAVPGIDVRVSSRCINSTRTARRKDRCLGFHINSFTRLDTDRDHTDHCTILIFHQIDSEPFVKEDRLVFDVVLI